MIRALFVMEQHLGHATYFLNLRRFIADDAGLAASWAPVTYSEPGGLLERVPGVPRYVIDALRARAEVRRHLRSEDHDVTFYNTQVPAALAGSLVRSRPYVLATDITPRQYDRLGAFYHHAADRPDSVLARYKHWINRTLFKGAAHILPWSTWVRDSLISEYGVSPERITVLPVGVDLEFWRPSTSEHSGSPMRILFVGGDFTRKGGETLLRAFLKLPEGAAELHVVTRTAVTPARGVHVYSDLKPNDPQLVQLYRDSDVFAFPTEAEAFGISAVEAAASALATVATAAGGLKDIVIDGETGFLIPPGDADVLADRLRLFVEDAALRRRMGRAGRARAELYFDARRNAARTVAILASAAQGARL